MSYSPGCWRFQKPTAALSVPVYCITCPSHLQESCGKAHSVKSVSRILQYKTAMSFGTVLCSRHCLSYLTAGSTHQWKKITRILGIFILTELMPMKCFAYLFEDW
ncbi:hypothetical protein SAY87_017597 [Trapa incisa]|uniref:Uncharacterized protein n=1 Tax=Trapa incisa TaxID=236973 RepID=A0AAN7QVB9_9MYRT|nr:hypothetical protein SAY87_017597 [Trapa incisa]